MLNVLKHPQRSRIIVAGANVSPFAAGEIFLAEANVSSFARRGKISGKNFSATMFACLQALLGLIKRDLWNCAKSVKETTYTCDTKAPVCL